MAKNDWLTKLCGEFGKVASDVQSTEEIIRMPSPSLNFALGNGGIAEGKVVISYGPESAGKSLVSYLGLIAVQKKYPDGLVMIFDAEYAFMKEHFKKLGGDLNRTIVIQTNNPLKIFDYIFNDVYQMLQDGAPLKAIMIDSFRSIAYPKDTNKKESTSMIQGGTGAAYLPSALKRILPVIREYNVTLFGVQQVAEEMDQYKKMSNPYTLPDGRALKHFADLLLEVTKVETKDNIITSGTNFMGNDQQVGHKVRVKVKKNRLGVPARIAEFTLNYLIGVVNTDDEIVELAKTLSVISHPVNPETGKVNAQMWQFKNYPSVRGEDNMKKWVLSNPDVLKEVEQACYEVSDDSVIEQRNQAFAPATVDIDVDIL